MLYVGSEHAFSAARFHEICDNQGPLVAVAKSEHDCIFGYYSSVAWHSSGGPLILEGQTFLFKIIGNDEIAVFRQTQAYVNFGSGFMVANGHNFHIWDRANNVTSIGEINL